MQQNEQKKYFLNYFHNWNKVKRENYFVKINEKIWFEEEKWKKYF